MGPITEELHGFCLRNLDKTAAQPILQKVIDIEFYVELSNFMDNHLVLQWLSEKGKVILE